MTDNTQGELSQKKGQKNTQDWYQNYEVEDNMQTYHSSLILHVWLDVEYVFISCVHSKLCTSVNWLWNSLLTNHHDLKSSADCKGR
jgi:hypothetical protein